MKDAVKVTDSMLKNDFTIELSALKSHSVLVSVITTKFTHVIAIQDDVTFNKQLANYIVSSIIT